jgi:glycine/D-amino acid oxidase-like deaminating enzyme
VTTRPPPKAPDIVVVGGGLVGASLAYGFAREGARVCVCDEGDVAYRASRGNFALVWVQSKGLGMSGYAAWSKASADRWPGFAAALRDDTDIDVALAQPGGFTLCLSDAELQRRVDGMMRLHNQPDMTPYPYEILSHEETKRRLPAIGRDVAGAIYSPVDGHVNSLRLFRALHAAMTRHGVDYRPMHPVDSVAADGAGFRVAGAWGTIAAPRVVLAAGLDNARLAPSLGLRAPVRPQRGQIIVTEKVAPFLDHPTMTVRQTDEGGVMIGDSLEETGFDLATGSPIMASMTERAVRMFPLLADVNVVRAWSALRVMSPDGFPIYEQSAVHPGAFLATCHSGVTLAANHALRVAPDMLGGGLPPEVADFSSRRFDVPALA